MKVCINIWRKFDDKVWVVMYMGSVLYFEDRGRSMSRVCISVVLQRRNVYIYVYDFDDTKNIQRANTSKLITSKCNSLDVISLLYCYTTNSLLASWNLLYAIPLPFKGKTRITAKIWQNVARIRQEHVNQATRNMQGLKTIAFKDNANILVMRAAGTRHAGMYVWV